MGLLTRDAKSGVRSDEAVNAIEFLGKYAPDSYEGQECERCWKTGKVTNTDQEEPWTSYLKAAELQGLTSDDLESSPIQAIACVRCNGTGIDPNKEA